MGVIESVRSYDLNIPVGGAQNIDAMGDRVQFLSATDPFASIELRPNYTQGNINLMPGQGFRFEKAATGWVVFNKGTVALTGTLLIGSGNFFDQRISGSVYVIDGGKARTLSGTASMGYLYQAPTAAQYAHVQLWNPAASGKNCFIEQFSFFSTGTVAAGISVRSSIAALATLGGNPACKSLGKPASSMELRSITNAVIQGASVVGSLDKAIKLFKVTEPIHLAPGNGLTLINVTSGEDLGATFELFEETI
ncbi:hypothetical protein [Ralstonia sp.]|uniref:hypothetical protein n=1 Tax=Ralstonia sp. TaxID=54061 RepID=UPI0031D8D859